MFVPQEDLLRTPRPDAVIWKYFRPEYFPNLLETGTLFLNQASRFKDTMEGRMNERQRRSLTDESPGVVGGVEALHDYVRQRTWVTCFNVSEQEDRDMYSEYCGPEAGVAIRTTFARLESARQNHPSAREAFSALVTYRDDDYLRFKLGFLIFQKLPRFCHEQELRTCVLLEGEQINSSQCMRQFLRLPVLLNELIQQVYVHPQASAIYYEKICVLADRYLEQGGGRRLVRWSRLPRH